MLCAVATRQSLFAFISTEGNNCSLFFRFNLTLYQIKFTKSPVLFIWRMAFVKITNSWGIV